jgi:hypothetical protein
MYARECYRDLLASIAMVIYGYQGLFFLIGQNPSGMVIQLVVDLFWGIMAGISLQEMGMRLTVVCLPMAI